MRLILYLCWLLAVAPCYAQGCAATPEGAAIAVIGGLPSAVPPAGTSGYRVHDVQTDSVLQRVWVRVSRCDNASAPLVLVPVRANLAGGAQSPQPALLHPSAALENTAVRNLSITPPNPIAVHWGDAIKAVFVSSNVHMELDAKANGSAAIGDTVEILLARGDEPPHRMHGVLRAPGRVEVQP